MLAAAALEQFAVTTVCSLLEAPAAVTLFSLFAYVQAGPIQCAQEEHGHATSLILAEHQVDALVM